MEQADSLGNWMAYGAIGLFLLLLLILFVRTALMVGSVFLLALAERRAKAGPATEHPGAEATSPHD